MASEGPNSPSTVSESGSSIVWTDPSNIFAQEGTSASCVDVENSTDVDDTLVQLIISGSLTGDDKATDASIGGSATYKTFGSSTDTWTASPTVAIVNATNFGVGLQFTFNGVSNNTSKIIQATNFGFSIPGGSTIDGIIVESMHWGDFGTDDRVWIDHVRITVHYTAPTFQAAWATNSNILIGGGINDQGHGA